MVLKKRNQRLRLFLVPSALLLFLSVGFVQAQDAVILGYDTIGGTDSWSGGGGTLSFNFNLTQDSHFSKYYAHIIGAGGTIVEGGVYYANKTLAFRTGNITLVPDWTFTWVSADIDLNLTAGAYYLSISGITEGFGLHYDSLGERECLGDAGIFPATIDNDAPWQANVTASIYLEGTTIPAPTPTPTPTPTGTPTASPTPTATTAPTGDSSLLMGGWIVFGLSLLFMLLAFVSRSKIFLPLFASISMICWFALGGLSFLLFPSALYILSFLFFGIGGFVEITGLVLALQMFKADKEENQFKV